MVEEIFDNNKMDERRSSDRTFCQTPLMVKVCKEETISKIMEGYTQDVSQDGLRCIIDEKVPKGSTLWLKLSRDALDLCEEIESRAVILQQGILGKVMWINQIEKKKYDVGLHFVIREAKT